MQVDQVLPQLARRDAIGVHTINLRDGLRAAGIDSDIYYGSFEPDVGHEGQPVTALGRGSRDRWLLYQSSVGSPVYDIFAARSEPKLVNYHNITPARLLTDWEPEVAYEVALGPGATRPVGRGEPPRRGRLRLQRVRAALAGLPGHRRGAPPHRHARQERPTRPGAAGFVDPTPGDGGRGRPALRGQGVAAQGAHDLVKMLSVLRQLYDPGARLHLVGTPLGKTYEPALRAFIADLGLEDAVFLAGSVTEAELEAYYRVADAFVCASEHEGFCVPLAEAMGHGLPIVAYA